MSTIDQPKEGILDPTDPFRYGWRNVGRVAADGTWSMDAIPLAREDVRHPREGDHIVQSEQHRDDEYLGPVLRGAAANRPGLHIWADMGVDWSVEGLRYVCPDFTPGPARGGGAGPGRGTGAL